MLHVIQSARQRAYEAVNTGLITPYWQVGEYISRKIERSLGGDMFSVKTAGLELRCGRRLFSSQTLQKQAFLASSEGASIRFCISPESSDVHTAACTIIQLSRHWRNNYIGRTIYG